MAKILKPYQIREYYNKILRIPTYSLALSLRELLDVLEYATHLEDEAVNFINKQIAFSPESKYPEEYLPDRKFDFWAERYNNYYESIKVIKAINKSLPANKRFSKLFKKKDVTDLSFDEKKDSLDFSSECKPIFNINCIPGVLKILTKYFPSQENELRNIFETGNNVSNHLIFHGKATQLICTFLELKNNSKIIGVSAAQLEKWINANFKYKVDKTACEFKKSYLNLFLSRNSTSMGERLNTSLIAFNGGSVLENETVKKKISNRV